MVRLKLIGKKGSKACKEIRSGALINDYKGKTKLMPSALINYGLPIAKLNSFFKKFPSAKELKVINRTVGYSKYNVCQIALHKKILVPKTKLSLDKEDKKFNWLEKRTNSMGGKGICLARGKRIIPGKYYQEFINKRTYELRVHAFKWIPKTKWKVQKRLGKENEIAWNYNNGGRFVSVQNPRLWDISSEALDVSEKILNMLHMSFGAVDFLVDIHRQTYFLEINSAPGFSELSKNIYIDAFTKLKQLNITKLLKLN